MVTMGKVDHIHIAYAGTNRRNMFQGGKVWNSIVRNKIPYNGSISYIYIYISSNGNLNHSY